MILHGRGVANDECSILVITLGHNFLDILVG
ncbi:hypothetical protein Cha6605_6045 (plasmid) [Chamaesiphon minutus PCC 6605]|uniref:Uncharacterized protein n=1 Tax=Chamaesiphon minutus (strain ATCC 27169 / PCC 6605) TaxID=1173020 RepID=K9UQ01_CHAP6|nr:hypothetical protein Cha6605_6045 [Chamaesiphon minutus PCC 6605]